MSPASDAEGRPILIMVAPNGARRSKRDHPCLPLTATEIAKTGEACLAAGAGAIHLHVRDATGAHSLDAGAYHEAIAAIKARCGDELVIQTTTESAGRFTPAEQMASVRTLMPRAISLAPREILEDDRRAALHFLAWANEAGIAIQHILYDDNDLERLALLRSRGAISKGQPRVILVIGRYGDRSDSSVAEYRARFGAFQKTGLDRQSVWSICAFGRGEIACLQAAIADGGHARVGFENSVVDHTGTPATDNAERVALVAALARGLGRDITKGADAAAILGVRRR